MHTTVLFHGNCPDGIAAAFACWQHFGDEAQYLPVHYGQPVPTIPADHGVYIVDFSYPEAELKALLSARLSLGKSRAPYVVVLDHHASAQRDLASLQAQQLRGLRIHFDMAESGASLTWKYFCARGDLPDPTHQPDAWAAVEDAMPLFFKYVRDRDLWQWKLPDSKAVSLAFWAHEKDFKSIALFAQVLEEAPARLIAEGQAMQRYADKLVREQAQRATIGWIGEEAMPIVNTTTLFSEVGDYLCQVGLKDYPLSPVVAYYFDRADGKRQWGLRSRGDFDCSVLAKQYGGGGHPGAAGFVTGQDWRGEERP